MPVGKHTFWGSLGVLEAASGTKDIRKMLEEGYYFVRLVDISHGVGSDRGLASFGWLNNDAFFHIHASKKVVVIADRGDARLARVADIFEHRHDDDARKTLFRIASNRFVI